MICNTCQRQSHCLTHQLADQDQKLHRMLEQLRGCQRRQTQVAHVCDLQGYFLPRLVQFMEKISRTMARYLRRQHHLLGRQKL